MRRRSAPPTLCHSLPTPTACLGSLEQVDSLRSEASRMTCYNVITVWVDLAILANLRLFIVPHEMENDN
jgi:hypothetical protein